MFLRLEAVPGETITNCAEEAIRISTEMNVAVVFEFNGFDFLAYPNKSIKQIEEEYYLKVRNDQTTG